MSIHSTISCKHFLRRILVNTKIGRNRCLSSFNSTINGNSTFDSFLTPKLPVNQSYYSDPDNQQQILSNIKLREIENNFERLFQPNLTSDQLAAELIENAHFLPNQVHPKWFGSDCVSRKNVFMLFSIF